jgi:hypothetical protein
MISPQLPLLKLQLKLLISPMAAATKPIRHHFAHRKGRNIARFVHSMAGFTQSIAETGFTGSMRER